MEPRDIELKVPTTGTVHSERKPTIYDNDYVRAFRWARDNKTPSKFAVAGGGKYRNLFDELKGKDLKSVYMSLSSYTNADPLDFVYAFTVANSVPIRIEGTPPREENVLPEEKRKDVMEFLRSIGVKGDDTIISLVNSTVYNGLGIIYDEEMKRLTDYESIVPALLAYDMDQSIEGFQSTKFVREKTTYSFNPTRRDGSKLLLEEGFDIFNTSILSRNVPFIQYIDGNGKSYYKVWNNTSDYRQATRVASYQRKLTNIIHVTVWSPSIYSSFSSSFQITDEYRRITFYLETGKMICTLTTLEKNISIGHLQKALPWILLGTPDEKSITGYFYFGYFGFNDTILLDLVFRNIVYSKFLYMEERERPYSMKKFFSLYFTPPLHKDPTVNFSLTVGPPTREFNTAMGISSTAPAPEILEAVEDAKFVTHVRITRASSENAIEEFKRIFLSLMRGYIILADEVKAIYSERIPNMTFPNFEVDSVFRRRGVEGISRLTRLLERAPEVFPKGFSRRCSGKDSWPLIIDENDIPLWKATGTDIGGRQIMSFPLGDLLQGSPSRDGTIGGTGSLGQIYITCPSEKRPYPGLKRSTKLSDNKFVPCCFPSNQQTNHNSEYNVFFNPSGVVTDVISTSRRLASITKSERILELGSRGPLPKIIADVLSRGKIEGADTSAGFQRYGIREGPNSLLDCILTAIKEEDYILSWPISSHMSRVVSDYRKKIAGENISTSIVNTINVAVGRQELYDKSPQQIINDLKNEEVYLDPRLYCRLIEEYFNINLFIFSYLRRSESDEDEDNYMLIMPRHSVFHIRRRDPARKSVMIYLRLNDQERPHCELIINPTKDEIKSMEYMPPIKSTEKYVASTPTTTTPTTTTPTTKSYNFADFSSFLPPTPAPSFSPTPYPAPSFSSTPYPAPSFSSTSSPTVQPTLSRDTGFIITEEERLTSYLDRYIRRDPRGVVPKERKEARFATPFITPIHMLSSLGTSTSFTPSVVVTIPRAVFTGEYVKFLINLEAASYAIKPWIGGCKSREIGDYTKYNIPSHFKYPLSQWIDNHGKTRALIYDASSLTREVGISGLICLVVPPSPPLNINEWKDSIPRTEAPKIHRIFGTPSSCTSIHMNGVRIYTGFWYINYRGIKNLSFYVPIIPISSDLKIDEGPGNPTEEVTTSEISRIGQLKHVVDILLQYLKFILDIYWSDSRYADYREVVKSYFQQFIVVEDIKIDTLDYYSGILKLPRLLMPSNIIAEMKSLPFCRDMKFVIHSEDMAMRLYKYLLAYARRGGTDVDIRGRLLDRYYSSPSDFNRQDGVTIFVGESLFRLWITTATFSKSRYSLNVRTFLRSDLSSHIDPYLWKESGKYCIVQNVSGNSDAEARNRAISVGKTWNEKRINLGQSAKLLRTKYPYVVYFISSRGNIEPEIYMKGTESIYSRIIRYNSIGDNYVYASILPL